MWLWYVFALVCAGIFLTLVYYKKVTPIRNLEVTAVVLITPLLIYWANPYFWGSYNWFPFLWVAMVATRLYLALAAARILFLLTNNNVFFLLWLMFLVGHFVWNLGVVGFGPALESSFKNLSPDALEIIRQTNPELLRDAKQEWSSAARIITWIMWVGELFIVTPILAFLAVRDEIETASRKVKQVLETRSQISGSATTPTQPSQTAQPPQTLQQSGGLGWPRITGIWIREFLTASLADIATHWR